MLTVNAADHPLMRNFHKPEDEKRMVVILPEAQYDEWLRAPTEESMGFMRQYPAERLVFSAQG
jgi:putative SOS response-associated peptidase YedK